MALHGNELRPALPLGDGVGPAKLPGEAVGDADIARLAGLHLTIEAVQYVLDGGLPVPHVIDIQVHVIHAQVLKALVQHAFDVLLAGDARLDLVLGAGQELGRHHHLIPLGEIPKRTAHVLLAGAGLVGDGGVIEIDPQLQAPPDDLPRMFLVQRPGVLPLAGVAKAHAAHADSGDVQLAASKSRVFHCRHQPPAYSINGY